MTKHTSTEWQVRAEYTGALTQDQTVELVDGPVRTVTSEGDRIEVRATFTATSLRQATTRALDALTPAAAHVQAGNLSGPHRVTVETVATWLADGDPIGTAQALALLKVSDQRLRHLRASDPAFPQPRTVGGIEFYPGAAMRAYAAARAAAPRKGGRPRKDDEEILVDGLRLLVAHGDLDRARSAQASAAVGVSGSRFLAGKALLLARSTAEERGRVEAGLAGDAQALAVFRGAVERARELDPR